MAVWKPWKTVSGCVWAPSTPREKAALVWRKAPLFLLLGPRTADAVHQPHHTLCPSVRISTTTLRSWAASSMRFARVGNGCDTQSSVPLALHFRPRVTTRASSVRLRLVLYCSLDPLQTCVPFRIRFIPHTSSEGSQESETASCGRRLARGSC